MFLLFQSILHFKLPSLLVREVNFHADLFHPCGTIYALGVVQIILIMQYHRIDEIYWVVKDIALNHLPLLVFFIFRVLVMISLIHGLVVMLLCSTTYIDDNGLFFAWWFNIHLFLFARFRLVLNNHFLSSNAFLAVLRLGVFLLWSFLG